ncbi:MAG: twin-arginine translocase subunit TatC [Verrucomicrobiae bacterium]|nr:twin-arginine translocase subunit TatC [Verrucomicrobiae bacterium]
MTADEEKPFLAHLEDLRTMIVRVVITLLIGTIACFIFNKPLLELIQGPAKKAGILTEVKLPKSVSYEQWEKIRKLNKAAVPLSAEQRKALMDAAFADAEAWGDDADLKNLRQTADVHYVYLASEQLGEDMRAEFLQTALGGQPELLERAIQLLGAGTAADLDGRVSAITMQALSPTETFRLSIKLSLYAGIVVSFPLLFYFIAQFVFPGLTDREKKLLWPSLTIGFGLFLIGVVFAYYFVTVEALKFFHGFSKDMGVEDQWKIGEYVSFTTTMILIFGVSFELPVVVMALVKLDLLTHEFMRQTRSYAIVIILVVAAIITPTPDAVVLSALAGPMIILYEICIWLSWFIKRKETQEEAAEAAKVAERRAQVRPAAGALPVSTADASSEASEKVVDVRPYDQSDDSAHSHPDHDPYHEDHHAHDYDPYHGGYYDDIYSDEDSSKETGSDKNPETDSESSAVTTSDPTGHVELPEVESSESESPAEPTESTEADTPPPSDDEAK